MSKLMPVFNMNYPRLYENEDLESIIYDIVCNGEDYTDAIRKNNNYVYHYFLSPLRHDLFQWYPFKKEGSLLEIGASYGQLTSLFTKKVDHVVAVEDTKSKCDLISKRAKEATVLYCEFNDLQTDEKFDYIILCNIFEYSKAFVESENPYSDYLSYLKGFLKEDGVILMAISNRLGMKYFAGFKEEHTNQLFNGINGFKNNEYVQTFTKSEITSIIEDAEFSNYRFYYPYPNHDFAKIINTDNLINEIPYLEAKEFVEERIHFFDEYELNIALCEDNISQYFANSFLIEIKSTDKSYPTDNIDFIKTGSNRKDEFKINTIIWSDGKVSKTPITPKANSHIKRMFETSKQSMGKVRCLNAEIKGDSLYYDFINEKSYEYNVIDAIVNNDKDRFFKLVEDAYDAMFYNSFETTEYASEEFLKVFKTPSDIKFHCHEKSILDMIYSNMFKINDEFIVIDYEWSFDFPVPLEYLFYRVLNYHLYSNRIIREFTSFEEVFNHFNLDSGNIALFQEWECNFLRYILDRPPITNSKIIELDNIGNFNDLDYYSNPNVTPDKIESLKNNVLKQEKEINNKNKEIENILNSNSWRITRPLRRLKAFFKK